MRLEAEIRGMKSTLFCKNRGILFMFVFLTGLTTMPAFPQSSISHCATPEYRQFDFWAGDWDAFDLENPNVPAARVRVDRILDGCALHEDYEGVNGHKGESFSIYDASRKVWHQSWVTNRGELLTIEGRMEDSRMILSGVDRNESRADRQVRGRWQPVSGGVRETAVRSTDGGKTWEPWFDMMFRPHRGNSTADAAASSAVFVLDTQYQAAVAKNDAATMDRILADNFVLVTGSGKIYNKTDLLHEARTGRVHYQRQDDSDQIVRVWGDTAIVTAKLVEQGTQDGKPFDYTIWFSDTYVRTLTGWRYVFGQSSLPLPKTP
jgi:ketosteroid isomerase-like protein